MANNISNIPCSEKTVSKAFDIVKRALEAAHQLGKVKLQTNEIRKALETNDYDYCFDTAQKNLVKYRKMINSYTFLTGVVIIDVTLEEAHSKNITYWKSVLQFTEMLIYANEAVNLGLKTFIEKKLKELFLQENKMGENNNE